MSIAMANTRAVIIETPVARCCPTRFFLLEVSPNRVYCFHLNVSAELASGGIRDLECWFQNDQHCCFEAVIPLMPLGDGFLLLGFDPCARESFLRRVCSVKLADSAKLLGMSASTAIGFALDPGTHQIVSLPVCGKYRRGDVIFEPAKLFDFPFYFFTPQRTRVFLCVLPCSQQQSQFKAPTARRLKAKILLQTATTTAEGEEVEVLAAGICVCC